MRLAFDSRGSTFPFPKEQHKGGNMECQGRCTRPFAHLLPETMTSLRFFFVSLSIKIVRMSCYPTHKWVSLTISMPIPLNAEDYTERYRNLRPEKKKNLVCDMMVQLYKTRQTKNTNFCPQTN
jgi:hypothetical protein